MNPISLKTQRMIMFVPIVNVVNIFLCIYNHYAVRVKKQRNLQCVVYLVSYSVPVTIMHSMIYRMVVDRIPFMEPLIYALGIYIVPLTTGYGLIKYQEKYVFSNE